MTRSLDSRGASTKTRIETGLHGWMVWLILHSRGASTKTRIETNNAGIPSNDLISFKRRIH